MQKTLSNHIAQMKKCSFGRIIVNATSPTLAKDKLAELAEIGFNTQDIAEIYCC